MVTSLRSKWAVGKTRGGRISESIRNRRATRPPTHFQRNPPAGASWLFFRVACSTRMTQIWALRSRLEKQPTDLRRRHHYLRDGTLAPASSAGYWPSCPRPTWSRPPRGKGSRAARNGQIIRARILGVTLLDEAKRETPLRAEPHLIRSAAPLTGPYAIPLPGVPP